MTLQCKLATFGARMADVVPNAFHYWRPQMAAPFLVWAETGESDPFDGENRKQEQTINISVDYYTKTEFDPVVDEIQAELNNGCLSWRLDAVEFEEDTELIHYTWAVVL